MVKLILTMKTVITIKGVIPGLNGDDGLIRQHFRAAKKVREKYQFLISEQTKNKHQGPVTINYVGYKSILMDWDNFSSSFKHLGDALVKQGVIIDDKPQIVKKFSPEQIKCKGINQRVVLIIEDYE